MNEDFWIKKLKLTRLTEVQFCLEADEKVLFLADVHLNIKEDEKSKFFLSFLEQINEKVKGIFILGDFFNYYVGAKQYKKKCYRRIFNKFKELGMQGVRIYFISGNRDSLVNDELHEFNIQKISTWARIKIFQRGHIINFLATHGDILAFTDRMFRFYRLIISATELRELSQCFSIKLRRYIAGILQKTISSKRTDANDLQEIQTDINLIEKKFHKAIYIPFCLMPLDAMLIGHWHFPASIVLDVQNSYLQEFSGNKLQSTQISENILTQNQSNDELQNNCRGKDKMLHIIGNWNENQGFYIEFSYQKLIHKTFKH